jgi:hypothetical protein
MFDKYGLTADEVTQRKQLFEHSFFWTPLTFTLDQFIHITHV